MMTDPHIKKILDTLNPQQYLAATDRGRDVVVTAGAGSGKTKTLVARYTSLLAEGIPPRRIAAITFSIKAAREMRSRVRETLYELQQDATTEEERQKWLALSAQMDAARISTIHSLCTEILRAHPAEAGIDPRFETVDESLAAALRLQAVEDTLKALVDEKSYAPLLNNIFLFDLRAMLKDLLNRRLEANEAFNQQVDHLALITEMLHGGMHNPIIKDAISALRGMSLDELISDANEKLAGMVQNLLNLWGEAERAMDRSDLFGCAAALYQARRSYMKLNIGKNGYTKEIIRNLQTNFDLLINPITGGKEAGDQVPDPEIETLFSELRLLLRDAYVTLCQNYQNLLQVRQALDFDDLEQGALQLLHNHAAIRQHWQDELDAILVDEFQDTNRRQQGIIEALAGPLGRLFIVGDMRQSIYRFRQADVTVFKHVQDRIRAENGQVIDLPLTYRTHQPLLQAIDDLLSPVIGTQPDPARDYFVPYSKMEAFRKEPPGHTQPPHIELVIGTAENAETARPKAAQALALRLLQLKEEGQVQTWDEVALLFRASTGYADYETALEEAGIPFVTVAGRGFYDRPEIRDLINILRALADPLDDLAFAGLLRSPAFGLSDSALFLLRQSGLPYWEALQADLSVLNTQDCKRAHRAYEIVSQLLPLVARIPVAELLPKIVNATQYRAILAATDVKDNQHGASTTGGRLWRNLDKLLADALASEELRVRNYLDMIETLNDAGAREGEASAEAQGAVQLMTIHKAKGLEFKVVILAAASRETRSPGELAYLFKELGVAFKLDPPPMLYNLSKHIDKDQNAMEQLRLLYVALTRAEDKLIISAHATQNEEGKLSFRAWGNMLVEGLELMSEDLHLADVEPSEFRTSSNQPLRVWCLSDAHPTPEIFLPVEVGEKLEVSKLWPLYHPIQVSDLESASDEGEEQIDPSSWWSINQDSAHIGKILGIMVHKALERWRFPGETGFEQMLDTAALRAGLVQEDQRSELIQQAIVLLERLQTHPIWGQINASTERLHEVPYTLQVGRKAENGIIDLVYQDDEGWKIVEFKTDTILKPGDKAELLSRYAPQVQRYRHAVKQLLGIDAQASLCFLDDHGRVVLESM
ncbi:MAG: UvrD-helicase domain-containing protein [Chloroflexi bacterium]|nr:UvrD-helicase domain-containing protein [Chloroflexota bacterium]